MELKDADQTPIFNLSFFEQSNSEISQQKNLAEKNIELSENVKKQKKSKKGKFKTPYFSGIWRHHHQRSKRSSQGIPSKKDKKRQSDPKIHSKEKRKEEGEDLELVKINRLERNPEVRLPFKKKSSKTGRKKGLKNGPRQRGRRQKSYRDFGKF